MTSHELARKLLELPDLPVATHANGHTYRTECDSQSHGKLKIGTLKTYNGQHVVIGNISNTRINSSFTIVS